jgi:hypothetical protein
MSKTAYQNALFDLLISKHEVGTTTSYDVMKDIYGLH